MSNSGKSRVGAGAAARKRDRYTERMNACHSLHHGRDAMDAKYLNDPLYDKVTSLSNHLSIHYSDYTVNEIRTLVNMAANDSSHPMLQRYWSEIDGVVPVAFSDTDTVFEVGSGSASDFSSSPSMGESTINLLEKSAGPSDRIVSSGLSGGTQYQSDECVSSTSDTLARNSDLFTVEMARESVTAMLQEHASMSSKDMLLDVNQDDPSIVPVPSLRRVRTGTVESVEKGLVNRSALEIVVWCYAVSLVHFIPAADDDRPNENLLSVRFDMHGRKRKIAEVRRLTFSWFDALSSFLNRETRCSMLGLRVGVCIAGISLVCICGAASGL